MHRLRFNSDGSHSMHINGLAGCMHVIRMQRRPSEHRTATVLCLPPYRYVFKLHIYILIAHVSDLSLCGQRFIARGGGGWGGWGGVGWVHHLFFHFSLQSQDPITKSATNGCTHPRISACSMATLPPLCQLPSFTPQAACQNQRCFRRLCPHCLCLPQPKAVQHPRHAPVKYKAFRIEVLLTTSAYSFSASALKVLGSYVPIPKLSDKLWAACWFCKNSVWRQPGTLIKLGSTVRGINLRSAPVSFLSNGLNSLPFFFLPRVRPASPSAHHSSLASNQKQL